eukprot:562241-Pelagomonas_calceolata.AAC.1
MTFLLGAAAECALPQVKITSQSGSIPAASFPQKPAHLSPHGYQDWHPQIHPQGLGCIQQPTDNLRLTNERLKR